MNIVVLISGGGSNLQAIIDACRAPQFNANISAVISNRRDAFGLERAQQANIKTHVVEHQQFVDRKAFDAALRETIDQHAPDLVVLAGFMRILTAEFVDHYSGRLINIHPSLLPKFPGTNTHQRAINAKEQWHGASVHYVVPEVDAGPIIIQGRLLIGPETDAKTLAKRVLGIEHHIYPTAVNWIANQRLSLCDDQVLLDGETSSEQLQTFDL